MLSWRSEAARIRRCRRSKEKRVDARSMVRIGEMGLRLRRIRPGCNGGGKVGRELGCEDCCTRWGDEIFAVELGYKGLLET